MAELPSTLVRAPVRSIATFVIGLALFAGAVVMILSHRGQLAEAWNAAQGAPVGLIVVFMLAPLVNWILTSVSFWILTARYGTVPLSEMSALIGASWLLNHLPLRPGMVGRVACHKKFHDIPVSDSLKVLVQSVACSGLALTVLVMIVALVGRLQPESHWLGFLTIASPTVALAAIGAALRARNPQHEGKMLLSRWQIWTVGAVRYVDMLIWAWRYQLVFLLTGAPISMETAAALAVISQIASMAPVQLGLREWMVGLATGLLMTGSGTGQATGFEERMTPGLLADVLSRGAELALAIPIGLISGAWLWRRWRRARPNNEVPSGVL